MINPTTENFKCLQWNARGLTKSKLEEFRNYLSLVNPEVALLSETHWNSGFAPKCKSHVHILRKDRPNRLGGGVAILISKSLQFSPITHNPPDTIEAIGASILFKNNQHIDFTSIYIPRANCETEEIEAMLDRSNPYLLGGDFNGHHPLWESNATVNKAGKSVYEALINDQDACLITPPNLGTRLDPVSGKASTIDLTITAASIATSAKITLGPFMGSDHLPIIITLNASVKHYTSRPIAWAINEEKWPAWNKRLEELLISQNFSEITDPATATTVFTDGLEASNEQFFRRTSPSCRATHKGPARPWWYEECKKAENHCTPTDNTAMTRFLDLIAKNKKVMERLKPVTSIEQWEFPTQDALDNYITEYLIVSRLSFNHVGSEAFITYTKKLAGESLIIRGRTVFTKKVEQLFEMAGVALTEKNLLVKPFIGSTKEIRESVAA
ncbi:hypothetical protein DAPPUDRAFT_337474 [Daphnia pulex]|uniref:Endonuclease/exonuclease/phosphatase domain-containing protein n=1 Tax=Daphnia pulex TaxID=6669 RepID=E9I1P9_DAPPU|nr:hypothetical protein DAPPUDRAFT_337474 [Daphnia pulex]|eukprot:EFX62081.1 hypothetical protein DAPPUDRAFT_337474 [Daphnia pulex]